MVATRAEAIAWGRSQVDTPDKDFTRLCLQFVRMAFGLPAVYPDAGTAWDRAVHRHTVTQGSQVPRGVPVFWELPSVADHVALSLGDGWCLSNDIKRRGRIDRVRIDSITTAWGGQLLGWTEDLNGTRVYDAPPKPVKPLPPNRVAMARQDVSRAIRRLDRAVTMADRGAGVQNFRRDLKAALKAAPKR